LWAGRFRYHFAAAGYKFNIVASEWVGDFNYDSGAENVRNVVGCGEWYDTEFGADMIGWCPFTLAPTPGWLHQNYNPFYESGFMPAMLPLSQPPPDPKPPRLSNQQVFNIVSRMSGTRNLIAQMPHDLVADMNANRQSNYRGPHPSEWGNIPGQIQPPTGDPKPLTERQADILRRFVAGQTGRQIGLELGISHKTAYNVMVDVRRKLNADSSLQAVATAFRMGIIE
jgi:DNA-binding CsgD family transcriptional regulator